MRQSINFQWVKQQIDPERAFELLDLTMRRQRDHQWRGNCPACQSDRTFVYTHVEGFTCHSCGEEGKGDVIALAAFALDLPGQWEGAFELCKREGIPLKPSDTVRTSKSTSRSTSTRNVEPESEPVRKPPSPRGGGRNPPPHQHRAEFDPAAFAEKLAYTDEVEALGISEEEALALGIGFHRNKLYQALRWPNGQTAGYSWIDKDGALHLPAKLIPMDANVVPLRRRA
jgi:hypothetical protein